MNDRTYAGYDMPDVLVDVDGVWCPGELRQWTQRDDGWWGNVQYRGPEGLRMLGTFPADCIKQDDGDYGPPGLTEPVERETAAPAAHPADAADAAPATDLQPEPTAAR